MSWCRKYLGKYLGKCSFCATKKIWPLFLKSWLLFINFYSSHLLGKCYTIIFSVLRKISVSKTLNFDPKILPQVYPMNIFGLFCILWQLFKNVVICKNEWYFFWILVPRDTLPILYIILFERQKKNLNIVYRTHC